MKTKQSNKNNQGMVLIVALIMLAMVTFMVVAFLAYARVDRSSVAMSMRDTKAQFLADGIDARVQAIMNRAMNDVTDPFANGAGASQNEDGNGTTRVYTLGELTGLQTKARPPVYVDLDGDGVYDEFRYFLNLNHDINATGGAIYQPTTPEKIGDPHWIGVLEDSNRTHGPDNRFVARYAYLVVPVDKQLDINRVHNKDKSIPRENGAYPEGYQRRHGNACWEMNLAGALAMIDPQMFGYGGYVQQGHQSSIGRAFEYAGGPHFELPVYAGLWNYRYPNGLNLGNIAQDRRNQREFIDMLDFLKEPGLGDVFGEEGYPNNPSDYHYLHNYFKNPAESGRAFYDMLGSITTHAAVAPANHLSPQTMKPILGMPPTEKLLINEFFTDDDFYHPTNPTSLNNIILTATRFEVNEAVGTAVAEVILFDENHGLTTGQNVFLRGGSAGVESTLHHPGSSDSIPPRELYVQVLNPKKVTLWDVPVRPGNPMAEPLPIHKVRFQAYQRNGGEIVYDAMNIPVPVSDLSAFPEEFTLYLSYEPLAKKFTQLASLMLQNAMVRTGGNFHIGSDPDLVLFDKVPTGALRETAARYFGANNIQIYPPDENNFTPEVQRLLQVALNLTEVYSPNTGYDINGDGIINNNDLRLAWPLVFRPIIVREAGDKVYIAGWRRIGRQEPDYWTNIPWWTNSYDLPVIPPIFPAKLSTPQPHEWLGKVPDAQRPGIAPDPNPKAPPVYGSEADPIPLLIGVNKGTQADVGGAFKIWPSVNELSASVEWGVDHSTGDRTPKLRVGVELRDNLLTTSLHLRLLVRGTISGTLNGAGFTKEIFLNQGLPKYLPTTLEVERHPFLVYYPLPLPAPPTTATPLTGFIPLGLGTGSPSQRASWKVDNLVLKADIVIVCTDPNYPTRERVIDMARVDFSADLPPQWKSWQGNFEYKIGDQVELGGERYYAREDHLSSPDTLDAMKWRPAYREANVKFLKHEVIRCKVGSDWRLYRCVKEHTSPGSFTAMVDGQWLWKPYWGEVYEMSWQVNDPLVNGMGRDYTLVHPLVPNNPHPLQPPYILYLTGNPATDVTTNNLGPYALPELGGENFVHRPWNVVNTSKFDPPLKSYARPWGDSYDFTSLKDPGVFSSVDWMFPHKNNLPAGSSAALETIGWLGLVHRGTPWQTVYLKSKPADRLLVKSIDAVSGVITADSVPFFWDLDFVKLAGNQPLPSQPLYQDGNTGTGIGGYIRYDYSNPQMAPYTLKLLDGTFTKNLLEGYPEGYMHNLNDPASWLYLVSTYPWQRATGTKDTLPTNDHRLVDIFSTPPSAWDGTPPPTSDSEAAQTSLLSVNAKSPAAWAAVLSGVAVPFSKKKGITLHYFHRKHPGNCTETDCARFDYRLAPPQPNGENPDMRDLVESINEHRVLHGGDQNNKNFERVSDILSVPELTISQPAYQFMIARREVDRGEAPEKPTDWAPYYPDELDYERIPQQILSLLRTDSTPRFVAYVFIQILKPARGSLDEDGLCSNYAIDSEVARRTVLRIDGMEKLREYHYRKKLGLPNPNPNPGGGNEPPSTRVVKESTVPLKLR